MWCALQEEQRPHVKNTIAIINTTTQVTSMRASPWSHQAIRTRTSASMPTPFAGASPSAMHHGQIVMFGLIDGLIPCPAAITVLLLCLQPGEFTLGATLVLFFSLSLAAVMGVTGVAAALATRHIGNVGMDLRRWHVAPPYFWAR